MVRAGLGPGISKTQGKHPNHWATMLPQALVYSVKSRDSWRVIHCILRPNPRPLHMDPDKLDIHFSSTAERKLKSSAEPLDNLTHLIDNLPDIADDTKRFLP